MRFTAAPRVRGSGDCQLSLFALPAPRVEGDGLGGAVSRLKHRRFVEVEMVDHVFNTTQVSSCAGVVYPFDGERS